MKKIIITLFILSILSAGLFANGGAEDLNPTVEADFAGYQSWTKVNSETITGDAFGVLAGAHERAKGFREIYVNDIGRPVEFGEVNYPFPVGSIIVKESYKNKNDSKGALSNLTIMVKRESGFSSDYGDWEYIITNSKGSIKSQGAMGSCIACHAKGSDKDYTFFNAKM